jgi:hypothetical protein
MPMGAFSSVTPAMTDTDDLKINKNYMGLVKFTDAETQGLAWRFWRLNIQGRVAKWNYIA